jgi:hypothetical protein
MRYARLNELNVVQELLPDLTTPTSGGRIIKIPGGIACHVGWVHNGLTFDPPRWTSYQFLLRLTAQERMTIRQLAATDPNVADFLMLAQSAQEVVSTDPMTLAGMNYMVSVGVFTEQRKNEVLGLSE